REARDQGSKRKREGKEPESTSTPKEKATKTTGKSTKGSNSHHKTVSKSAPAEEAMQTTQDFQPWISDLAKKADSRSSFNELMDTPVTTDQLDWNNPEGHQYPHNLLKPLPLIPNSRGRRLIPFDHFINNDLEYLHGGASSRKYTTSITKTQAADYGHIKWIRDLFYRFAVNRDSARDVYSKRRIMAIIKLQIVEWHNYKHLDWITVHRDDDKLYKFKEGDFKRLRIQDIKDMLLLLVQGKLTNLTVKERFAFNVSPDTYRSDLKRKEAYTAYSNPRGFIYQNKDKQNRLMRIDELHKFSDGMLNDVRIALDDRLKAKDEEDHAKSRKVHWWEIVRGRIQDATTEHMIYHMMSLSYKGRSSWIRRTLEDGGEGTCFQLSQRFIAACSYPNIKYKDIMKAQVHVSRLSLL
nr:hypothetical protein [Tanacetum cinerariifolium]